ncbi:MAG: PASTA domain-containing protein [Actinobacteria bacterium]|nr:PASTA domain-containing protein [Actinomycetota bacterium]MBW3649896.1 PASTA domain-containing protein [Actinomycetota bacterium]
MATPRIVDQIGRVLGGRYRLVAPIGTGASAHVYVADDVSLGRRVAVKILHPALARDESFLRRFRAEAQAVAGLRHAHIMNVYDWGQDEDGPFLVLEHLEGGSLRDILDAGHRLSPSQALQVGLEAARGLEYAHRRGLVHRDIKPANLLFDDEGRLCIADFGLARALAEAAWTEPAGAVLGTARYASPEQARGSSVDGKADVYALALSLVEAVTGRLPFAADTTIATLMARIDKPLDVPGELGPLVPALAAAGAADPASRVDAAGLARMLEDAAPDLARPQPLPLAPSGDLGIDLTRSDARDLTVMGGSGRSRLFDIEAEGAAAGPAGALPPRRRRRLPVILFALLAVVALVAGALAVVAVTKPSYNVPDLQRRTVADARRLTGGEQSFRIVEVAGDFYREDVPPGEIVAQDPAPRTRLKQGGVIRVQVSDGPEPRLVPDLAGKPRAEAQQLLSQAGLGFVAEEAFHETVPNDHVIDWSPKDGRHPRGSPVTVTISKGKEPKPVPSFLDRPFEDYQKLLEGLGFKVKKEEAFSDKFDAGQIITTRPPPGEEVVPGSEVTVVVSKGPDEVAIPDVAGRSVEDAINILQRAGLKVAGPFGPPNARRAYGTSPEAGKKVKRGSTVDLYTGR